MGKQPLSSRPIKSPRNKPTAIINQDTAEWAAIHTIRWSSIGVLVASFVGTIVALNGGVPQLPVSGLLKFWTWVSPIAVLGGVIIQGLCTTLEWGFRKRRSDPRYFVPLIFDFGGTYLGYAPLLVPFLANGFTRAGIGGIAATIIGHIGVALLSILAAYYPEQNLIDE